MKTERALDERIAACERKLELRRDRTVRHLREVRTGVSSVSRWLPLVVVGGALAIGIVAARRHTTSSAAATAVRRTGWLATAVAIAGTGVRVATSPQARALWSAWRGHSSAAGR
jgi:hypothetical protein